MEDIGNSAVEGFVGGAIMSPLIGGGMKATGKAGQKVFGKDNVNIGANGNKVHVNEDKTVVKINDNASGILTDPPDTEIHIPKGILASDIALFTETDAGFRNIVRNRAGDIAELNKIKDTDTFLEKGFQILKEEMGIADSPIKLKITNDGNEYDLVTNTVAINRNWADGDKAELFGAMAHELNHFLQWKEVIRNLDEDSPMYSAVIEQLSSTEVGTDNLLYILNKYEDVPVTQISKEQAKTYAESWSHYLEPNETNKPVDILSEQYHKYKAQPVEVESFRRGEIVAEEYRKALAKNKITLKKQITEKRKLDTIEQLAINEIETRIKSIYPNISSDDMQLIIDDAIKLLDEPKYSDMHYMNFVDEIIKMYTD